MELQGNADSSKHTPEILTSKKTNTTNIGINILHPIDACKRNYSESANYAKEKSIEADTMSKQANSDINNAKKSLDQILSAIPRLQQVNATRLVELQNEIKTLRTEFAKKNVEMLNAQLKIAKDQQQTFINDYKKKIQELRNQVEEMKQLRNSLSSVAYRGCT
jgi:type I site-specific restriction endonuclease